MDTAELADDVQHPLARRRIRQPMPRHPSLPDLFPGPRLHVLAGYSELSQVELQAQALPSFEPSEQRYRYGARSEAAVFVGELLYEVAPELASEGGWLDIVAIARRPGVLSKIAVRPRAGVPAPLVISIGADYLAQVSRQLDGERIQVVRWQRSAVAYIADALGLGEVPPVLLLPTIGHARILLGEIDVRGIAGWRGLNTVLASALTGWRIRLEPVASTEAWRRLHSAFVGRGAVVGTVVGHTDRGPRLSVNGLYAVLSGAAREYEVGEELEIRITRMDPDEGRIFASDRLVATGQLPLI